MDLRLLIRALFCLLAGRRDDAALLGAASLGTDAPYGSARRLRQMDEPFPSIDLAALRACVAGTLGQAYVAHMDRQRRWPYVVSAPLRKELAQRHRLAVRSLLLREVVQVLLGFDSTAAGRLGVLGFVAAQRDGPATERALALSRWRCRLTMSATPGQLRRCEFRGRRLGERARSLILEPLEQRWDEPLDQLRGALGLPSLVPGIGAPSTRREANGGLKIMQ